MYLHVYVQDCLFIISKYNTREIFISQNVLLLILSLKIVSNTKFNLQLGQHTDDKYSAPKILKTMNKTNRIRKAIEPLSLHFLRSSYPFEYFHTDARMSTENTL